MSATNQNNLRFPSLSYDPVRTRESLRDRFERFLPFSKSQTRKMPSDATLSDEAFLRLLLDIRITRAGSIENAKSTYEDLADSNAPFPTLDSLIDAGWVRTGWGQVYITVDAARAAKEGLIENLAAYQAVQVQQYEQTFSFSSTTDPHLAEIQQALLARELSLRNIVTKRPEWVAARMWEELLSECGDDQIALRRWLDLWHEIGYPHIVLEDVWSLAVADRFREAAITLLEAEPLFAWSEIVERFAREAANVQQADLNAARSLFLEVPNTVVGRYLWATSNRHERAFHAALWSLQPIAALANILMCDVEGARLVRPPHALFARVMGVIEQHPELMFFFILSLRNRPLLLADLLLLPVTSAWSCLLVWQWQLKRDPWGNQSHRQDDERNKASIFADATSVLRYLMNDGKIHSEEIADLVKELFRYERATADTSLENSNAMRLQFLSDLSQGDSSKVVEVLNILFNTPDVTFPGTGTFDGALALIECSRVTSAVDPVPLVDAYVAAMGRDDYNLSAHQITAMQAKTLYELALRTGTDGEARFLDPLQAAMRMGERSKAEANPFTIADAVSRTIRVHARILARAIVAQSEDVPEKLVDALVKTVETGALNRAERHQVDAFAANYESDFPAKSKDRSISADLGDALSKLSGTQRGRLLEAILKIEEPLALVRLLFFTPAELKGRVEQRVKELTPEKATELYMYTAAQIRIDQLLDADFPDVAEAFLESEASVTTSWSVPGRAVHRLRQQLRLHFLRREWTEIHEYEIPEGIPGKEMATAKDTIEFFRGLASLKMNQDGAQDAESRFEKLQRAHPDVAAYAVNLHAARVSLLLKDNSFGFLDGEKLAEGFRVISEGQDACSHFRDITPDDQAIFSLNNAILFLAARQPARAIESLNQIPEAAKPQETAFAYRAIALARGGEPWLARGVLEAGLSLFGNMEILEAARSNIQSATPFSGRVNLASDPDVVTTIKIALHNLMALDPGGQVSVLTTGNSDVGDFLLSHFRQAGAATVDLAPMMRALNADSIEDDISAILKEILHARLGHIRWSVSDQGRGGFTPKGGPGERDFTIKQDASILSVGEAVMTRNKTTHRFTRGELQSHLQKLFAYATCPAYFHVTYEMSGDEAGVLAHLRKISADVQIEGIEFMRHDEIPFVDSAPRGFTAHYRSAAGTQTVHFLVLDFHQGRQKAAALASDASNPRK